MEIFLKKLNPSILQVCDPASQEAIMKMKLGQTYKAKVTRSRNYKYHKKFFALLNYAFHNQDVYDNFDSFRYELIIQTGHYSWHASLDGKSYKIAESISFDKMDEAKFEELFSRSIDIIIKHFMPTATEDEILNIIGFD